MDTQVGTIFTKLSNVRVLVKKQKDIFNPASLLCNQFSSLEKSLSDDTEVPGQLRYLEANLLSRV